MAQEPDISGLLTRHHKGGKEPYGYSANVSGYSMNKDPRINGNVGTKIDVLADQPPDRHELFLLEDGEKKVELEPETRKLDHFSLLRSRR